MNRADRFMRAIRETPRIAWFESAVAWACLIIGAWSIVGIVRDLLGLR